MTNDSILTNNDVIRNSAESSNKIKFNMHEGYMRGNIIDEPILLLTCLEGFLDFSCPENSEYIILI